MLVLGAVCLLNIGAKVHTCTNGAVRLPCSAVVACCLTLSFSICLRNIDINDRQKDMLGEAAVDKLNCTYDLERLIVKNEHRLKQQAHYSSVYKKARRSE
eukprot:2707923-Pleurochrysis_carterae.AAC.1